MKARILTVSCAAVGLILSGAGGFSGAAAHAAGAPRIPLHGLLPLGRGNSVYTHMPLSAEVLDTGSGVDVESIRFTLRDLTAGTQVVLPASRWSGGIAQTAPQSFTIGHVYSFRVEASDLDGDLAFADQGTDPAGGFLVVDRSVSSPTAHLEDASGTLTPLATTGTQLASFPTVALDVDTVTVTMSGTQHAGFGYVDIRVPLSSAEVCGAAAGEAASCLPAYDGADPSWEPRFLTMQFSTMAVRSSTRLTMQAGALHGVQVGPLTARVPATWTSATLRMPSFTLSPVLPTCSGVSDANYYVDCNTDPLSFYLSDSVASQVLVSTARMHHADLSIGIPDPTGFLTEQLWYLVEGVSNELDGIVLRQSYPYHTIDASTTKPSPPPLLMSGTMLPASYPGNYPAVAPSQVAGFCLDRNPSCPVTWDLDSSATKQCNNPDAGNATDCHGYMYEEAFAVTEDQFGGVVGNGYTGSPTGTYDMGGEATTVTCKDDACQSAYLGWDDASCFFCSPTPIDGDALGITGSDKYRPLQYRGQVEFEDEGDNPNFDLSPQPPPTQSQCPAIGSYNGMLQYSYDVSTGTTSTTWFPYETSGTPPPNGSPTDPNGYLRPDSFDLQHWAIGFRYEAYDWYDCPYNGGFETYSIPWHAVTWQAAVKVTEGHAVPPYSANSGSNGLVQYDFNHDNGGTNWNWTYSCSGSVGTSPGVDCTATVTGSPNDDQAQFKQPAYYYF